MRNGELGCGKHRLDGNLVKQGIAILALLKTRIHPETE